MPNGADEWFHGRRGCGSAVHERALRAVVIDERPGIRRWNEGHRLGGEALREKRRGFFAANLRPVG